MRSWLYILAGAIVLLLFSGTVYARSRETDNGELTFDPEYPIEGNMTPATWFSSNAVDNIKREEGLSLTAYADAAGWSIGYGHYLGSEKTVERISQVEADAYFAADLETAAQLILDHVGVPLSQNQFDALMSFVYNLGPRAFQGGDGGPSTWLTLLNSGDYQGAADQLLRWAYSEGRINSVLIARRGREKDLFMTA